jgi:peptidylprolyl isomerase
MPTPTAASVAFAATCQRAVLLLVGLAALLCRAGVAHAQGATSPDWVALDPEYTLYIEVPRGRIVVALSKDLAQGHVSQLRTLARAHYFDGLQFYRVVEGFLAQGGDFGESRPIPAAAALQAEFDEPWSEKLHFVPLGKVDEFGEQAGYLNGFPARHHIADGRVWLTRCTGVIGLGRENDPNTANAHFWIALQPIRANDRQDTVFGRVVWGMEYVSTMTRTGAEPGDSSRWTPIVSVRVAADVPPAQRTGLQIMDTNSEAFQTQLEERRNPTAPPAADWFVHRPRNQELCGASVPVRAVPKF